MTDQVTAAHILVMHEDSARSSETRTKDEAKTMIDDVKAKIADGADFAELAGQVSDCPSGSNGGSLGQFGRGQMVKAFEDTAFALEPGETSDIIETEFGYHLILRSA
ncbi:MAG: parvulin peptidyl-prolyl isomerase [Rhodospirillaceae bacterium]|jgi:peptidyl-prolyl cis-trans isomerase C|nr:parvulin peptidyl-prolyl isomerase [Rhodospirillaceae bacterium]MBT5244294.1 parvulin peptidyl-prolyl isomerase [Rhodospirillaceae bacterium]MBT5563655.1 parvulin peptidyl-prolyl isomerase [Rhodospirillaceae bacterium]MBT6241485.1 parvulin peptidyl-prolyl isomerase [Rhodospirillaceae bacterium]MBT7138812.1 parvulin peptidyl-prolyl isomerase [Rhodospirillaceae bacterium]